MRCTVNGLEMSFCPFHPLKRFHRSKSTVVYRGRILVRFVENKTNNVGWSPNQSKKRDLLYIMISHVLIVFFIIFDLKSVHFI